MTKNTDLIPKLEQVYKNVEADYNRIGKALLERGYIEGYKRTKEIVEYEEHPEYDEAKKAELLTRAIQRTISFIDGLERKMCNITLHGEDD